MATATLEKNSTKTVPAELLHSVIAEVARIRDSNSALIAEREAYIGHSDSSHFTYPTDAKGARWMNSELEPLIADLQARLEGNPASMEARDMERFAVAIARKNGPDYGDHETEGRRLITDFPIYAYSNVNDVLDSLHAFGCEQAAKLPVVVNLPKDCRANSPLVTAIHNHL